MGNRVRIDAERVQEKAFAGGIGRRRARHAAHDRRQLIPATRHRSIVEPEAHRSPVAQLQIEIGELPVRVPLIGGRESDSRNRPGLLRQARRSVFKDEVDGRRTLPGISSRLRRSVARGR